MTARLRILMETVPDTDVVASMLPAFRAGHPDVQVEVEAMHYDYMRGPTLASLRADQPDLDLVILDNPWVEGLVGAAQLEPLDERIAATGLDWDGYYPTLRSAAELDGRIWGGAVLQLDTWPGVPARPLGDGRPVRTWLPGRAGSGGEGADHPRAGRHRHAAARRLRPVRGVR